MAGCIAKDEAAVTSDLTCQAKVGLGNCESGGAGVGFSVG